GLVELIVGLILGALEGIIGLPAEE
ncbi:MAG: hypothetical protein RLZZ303_813, partial [Candidatus Hydrogenedentota bacterium]